MPITGERKGWVPAAGVFIARATLELAYGRDAGALAVWQAAEQLAGLLAAPNPIVTAARAFQVVTLMRLGETGRAEQAIAGLDEQDVNKRCRRGSA